MTWCTANSTDSHQMNRGSRISPNIPREKEKSTAAPSWIPSPERSLAGPSTTRKDSALVVNALDMAIKNRQPPAGGIVHADHGVQFTSWAFTNKI